MGIGSAILSLGTSLLNNHANKKIAQQTNNTNQQIANNALNQQKAEFGTVTGDAQPYLDIGNKADVTGANYQQSPGFQNALKIGTQNVLGQNSLNGLLRSGSAIKALDNYTVGAADQDYNNYIGQQQNNARIGEGALGTIGSAAYGASSAIGQNAANLTGSNNALGADLVASNNANTNALNTAGGSLFSNPNFNSFLTSLAKQAGNAFQGGGGSSYTTSPSNINNVQTYSI